MSRRPHTFLAALVVLQAWSATAAHGETLDEALSRFTYRNPGYEYLWVVGEIVDYSAPAVGSRERMPFAVVSVLAEEGSLVIEPGMTYSLGARFAFYGNNRGVLQVTAASNRQDSRDQRLLPGDRVFLIAARPIPGSGKHGSHHVEEMGRLFAIHHARLLDPFPSDSVRRITATNLNDPALDDFVKERGFLEPSMVQRELEATGSTLAEIREHIRQVIK